MPAAGKGIDPFQAAAMIDPKWFWKNFVRTGEAKNQIAQIRRLYPEERTITIDVLTLKGAGSNKVIDDILDNPGRVIESIMTEVEELLDPKTFKRINIRFIHLPRVTSLSHVRLEDETKLIALNGIIKRASDIRKRCTLAYFKCAAGHPTLKKQGWGAFVEPNGCGTDGCTFKKLEFVPKRSTYEDFQRLTIQETTESSRAGEQPRSISVEMTDDLCGKLVPGDKVVLNGRIRSYQLVHQGQKSTDFGYYFELNSFDPIARDYDEVAISDEDLKAIQKIAANDPLKSVSESIAPTIYGYREIKNAIALQLIGGNSERNDETGHNQRGDSHILICGDPGVAKSDLVRQTVKLSPRGVYVNAKSSSSAGLTVTVTKDEVTGQWVAEAGALPLADRGIAGIDELNLLHKNEQASLHEAMEGQQISIAKAGLVISMNARFAMLAASNPKYGRFDLFGDALIDQVDISAPLMSRFDFIFLMTDTPEEKRDRRLADHILKNRRLAAKRKNKTITAEEEQQAKPVIATPLLRKYIAYCKTLPAPESTPESEKVLADFFVSLRMKNSETMAFTPRALEATSRLAEASARMRLSKTIEKGDAEKALDVLRASLKQVATDPTTGEIDINRVIGTPQKKRSLISAIKNAMVALNAKVEQTAMRPLLEELAKQGYTDEESIADSMDQMRIAGDLLEVRRGIWKLS